jgi:hypothetical protein
MAPFHIKSQLLRRAQLGPGAALDVFEPRGGPDAAEEANAPARGKARWRQSDLKRAIAAAQQAELESYRVEIAPDGTIAIIVGAPADTADPAAGSDPYKNLLGK